MIDLKQLRADPARFKNGARDKGVTVDIDRLLQLDEQMRHLKTEIENRRAEQNRLSKEVGPQIGKLKGQLKSAPAGTERNILETQIRALERRIEELAAAPSRRRRKAVSETGRTDR